MRFAIPLIFVLTAACAVPIESDAAGGSRDAAAASADYGADLGAYLNALSWPGLFGEYRVVGRFAGYPRAENVFARVAVERAAYEACDEEIRGGSSDGAGCPSRGVRAWREALVSFRALGDPTSDDALRAVSRFVNEWRNLSDGRGRDVWKSPLEFFAERGDCEDNAIAKYVSLRELGVPPGDLLVVVGTSDLGGHANVVVRRPAAIGGEESVALDNFPPHLFPPNARPRGFVPRHVLNENGAFSTRHLIGAPCGGALSHRWGDLPGSLGLECTGSEAGIFTMACSSVCPGDARTVCAELTVGGRCLHVPYPDCEKPSERMDARRMRDGGSTAACVPHSFR